MGHRPVAVPMNGESILLLIVTDLEGVEKIIPGKLSGKGTVKRCRQETAECSGSCPLQSELLAVAPWVAGTHQEGTHLQFSSPLQLQLGPPQLNNAIR